MLLKNWHIFDGVMGTLRHELQLISTLVGKREAPPANDWELLEVVPVVYLVGMA
jgi:hypothetical protein